MHELEPGSVLADTVDEVHRRAAWMRSWEVVALAAVMLLSGFGLWRTYVITDQIRVALDRQNTIVGDIRALAGKLSTTQDAIRDLADQTYADQIASNNLLTRIIDCHERTRTRRQYERCREGVMFDTRPQPSGSTPPPTSQPTPTPQPAPSPTPTSPSPTPCRVDNPFDDCLVR